MQRTRTPEQQKEISRCRDDITYFVSEYCYIYNPQEKEWIPFDLWEAQAGVLETFKGARQVIVLKARQLGLSWLSLTYALWLMLFHPAATVLILSQRGFEAADLLDVRLKGIYERLPPWMQADRVVTSNTETWRLSNGSSAMAFATTGGRGFTASLVIIDEADFVPNLDKMLNATKPTIDAGGQMFMISTSDKDRPKSPFKNIFQAGSDGKNTWTTVFLPWHVRPGRDEEWYRDIKQDIVERTGSDDDVGQEYPATIEEALAPRTLSKRIAYAWLAKCFHKVDEIADNEAPALPGLTVYRKPEWRQTYVLGIDPAEGNPNSDDSAISVLDVETGEEVANLSGKIQPTTLAGYAVQLADYYNEAEYMVERNNHGHAVIQYLENQPGKRTLDGYDDRPGWNSNQLGKALLYNHTADAYREGRITLHHSPTMLQLASIDGGALKAPEGQNDDLADANALAIVGSMISMAGSSAVKQIKVQGRQGPGIRRGSR